MVNYLKHTYRRLAIDKKINLFVIIITLATTLAMGIFSYISFKGTAINIIGGDTVKIADSIAAGINGDSIEKYNNVNKTDKAWDSLQQYLSSVKKRTGAYFVYIMCDDGDKYKYIVEGHVDGSNDDITNLGDTDEKSIYPSETQSVLDTGKSEYTDIYDNGSYGKVISGFTPIKNSSGKIVAVLGVDISANSAMSSVNSYLPLIAAIMVCCVILMVLLLRAIIKRIIIIPLNKITALEDKIAAGSNNINIDEKYLRQQDEIGVMFGGFKKMSDTYQHMLSEINNIALQHRQGNTSVYIDENAFSGIYSDVVRGVNDMAKDYFNDISDIIGYLDNISNGRFDAEIRQFPGDKAFINEKINLLKANLKNITAEIESLVKSAINGELSDRADLNAFYGDWRKLAELLNGLLDAVVKPIIESSTVLNELADGNIEAKVSGEYKGSYAQIKNSLNRLTAVIGKMTCDVKTIAAATIEGNLTIRADAGGYKGEYRRIVDYMNQTVDAVQKPVSLITGSLNRLADGTVADTLSGEFRGVYADMINSTNALIMSISNMLDKTNGLMLAARDGNLEYRAETTGLKGRYAEIVVNINSAMDAVVHPINEIADVIREISGGNLNKKVSSDYKGSINILKSNVNLTVDTLNEVIKSISLYTESIASGDIDLDALPSYSGDYNKISHALNKIVDSLNGTMKSIRQSSDQIASESLQIAEGSRSLSSGSTEQAGSVEQLNASIGEISAQAQNNTRSAAEVDRLAGTAKDEAASGNARMEKMLGAISEIGESSKDITKIIKTINDIAFQTNILALNAAVEAARAGQYGKGFAVVADEVRSLANRSAQAAKDSGELINQSNLKVSQGIEIADDLAQSLRGISDTIGKVSEHISSIVAASNEQSAGVSQINRGIEAVSAVVQTNAKSSEESAAFSEELSAQAELLKELVGSFKLREE